MLEIKVATKFCGQRLQLVPLLLYAAVFMIVFQSQPTMAQWTTQSPVPTFLDVRGVAAPTAQSVFIATDDDSFDDGGALFQSDDGGATWVQRNVPFSLGSPLNGIFFLDDNLGWAYGNENYRTIDGGTTWSELPFLGSTYFMEFYSASFGLASGNFDRFVSRDSGLTWEASPNNIFAFNFTDSQTGLGVSDSGIYRTSDGGLGFNLVRAGNADAVSYLSASTAVAIVDSLFMRSVDGGTTWTAGDTADGRNRLFRVSAEVVLAWGRSGSFPDYDDRLLRSADGGQTWTDLGEVMPEGILAFAAADLQKLSAVDYLGNMFHSTDAGQNWSQSFTTPGPRPGFLSSAVPVFADAQTGYFGYGNGFIIKTADGGASWSQISSGGGESLNDVDRFADGRLIAVGDNGSVLTSSGAIPWTVGVNFTNFDLMAVQVIGPQDVVTVDRSGQVFTSSDGGTSWTAVPTVPAGLNAEDLFFTSLQDGWITGSGAIGNALFHTTDGGSTWTAIDGFGGAYVAVDIEGAHGWAANVSGRYYHSGDSGITWTQGNLPGSPLQIKDMDFYDENIGYAVGWWGKAFRSSDGGITWETLPTPNGTDNFTDIYLVGPNEFWLSTTSNIAYYSATGGQNWTLLDVGSNGFGSFTAITADSAGNAWIAGFQGYIEYFAGPPGPPLNRPPVASFDFVTTGLTVTFSDSSFDPDGSIVSWLWDFGDSTSSTEQNPVHTYAQANTYLVRLTVTDDDGDIGIGGRAIVAQPGPGGTFGDFTEVTPLDSLFVTPQDEDFWVITTAPADYDSDGDQDIAVLGFYVVYNQSVDYRLVLFRNDGPAPAGDWDFTYIDVPLDTLTAGSSDMAWGDVDNDGDQDLALGSDGTTVIYRNDGGNLVMTNTRLPAYWEDNDQADFDLRSITWADYDNDGDQDLLLPSIWSDSTFSYRTALMRNDGSNGSGGWIFTETDSVFAPAPHAQSAWADFDNDQDLDLLLINVAPLTDKGFIRRYRNDGNGVFVGEDILDSLTIEHGEAQWGDYDADGDLDILVAGHIKELTGGFSQALRIYRNDNEVYVPIEVISCVPCEGWFDLTAGTWADYDSDGDIDILLAGTYNSGSQIDGRARVYANTNGVFANSGSELPAPRSSGSRGGTFSWLDIDSDGDLDYVIAGQYFVPGGNGLVEAQMHVYRNDVTTLNTAPSMPGGLGATVQTNGTVNFSWQPASDDHTPADALTYDLAVFRDGVPINVPDRLPEPGNISAVNQWQLSGLPDGYYQWTLQAVDAAYSGGLAATGEFIVGDPNAVESGSQLPKNYLFSGNYPNPFNPSTTFRFELPERSDVELAVYNLRGQLVTHLVKGRLAAGEHKVQWNAINLASGIYFVRMSTAKYTKIRRVILLK